MTDVDGTVELPDGRSIDFVNYEPRIGPDGALRWWAKCVLLPVLPPDWTRSTDD